MYVEIFRFDPLKGIDQWQKIGDIFENKYWDIESPLTGYNKPLTDQPFDDRWYNLFGLLADVRNNLNDPICPISLPKGLPDDVSDEILEISNGWDLDGHSHSWLTIKEIIDYDWSKSVQLEGMVTFEQFVQYIKTGRPNSYCYNFGGDNTKFIEQEDMMRLLKMRKIFDVNDEVKYYTKIKWNEDYKSFFKPFIEDVIDKLKKLSDDPNDVRIVFWFDN